jgi:hypothetical protein
MEPNGSSFLSSLAVGRGSLPRVSFFSGALLLSVVEPYKAVGDPSAILGATLRYANNRFNSLPEIDMRGLNALRIGVCRIPTVANPSVIPTITTTSTATSERAIFLHIFFVSFAISGNSQSTNATKHVVKAEIDCQIAPKCLVIVRLTNVGAQKEKRFLEIISRSISRGNTHSFCLTSTFNYFNLLRI